MSERWYSRPVLFVASVERAVEFYTGRLGFEAGFQYQEEGHTLVGEVAREDCTLLLSCQEPQRNGHGRMFISLDPEPFRRLKSEFEERGAPVKAGWWGYELMVVADPDGNELFFPHPRSEAASPAA
jgi:catechol 2,3-dioxygenase-like lactoylglutathione lyase family enzyme